MQLIARLGGTVVLLAIAAFALFGFLASEEVADLAAQFVWRIGYGAIGIACLVGIWLVWSRRSDAAASVRHRST
jgi:hypothetical protein